MYRLYKTPRGYILSNTRNLPPADNIMALAATLAVLLPLLLPGGAL